MRFWVILGDFMLLGRFEIRDVIEEFFRMKIGDLEWFVSGL